MIHARYSPTLGRHLTKIFRPLGPIAHQLATAPTHPLANECEFSNPHFPVMGSLPRNRR